MSNDILAELARYLAMPIEYEFNAHGVMGGAIEEITRLRARVAHLERPVTDNEIGIFACIMKSGDWWEDTRSLLAAALKAALAAIPLDAVTRDRCKEAIALKNQVGYGTLDYKIGYASSRSDAVDIILALPVASTSLDQLTRDRCAEAVWGLYASPVVHPADDDAKDGWQKCCESAVAAIKGLPVAPPLMPTLEAIAKAI